MMDKRMQYVNTKVLSTIQHKDSSSIYMTDFIDQEKCISGIKYLMGINFQNTPSLKQFTIKVIRGHSAVGAGYVDKKESPTA